MNQRRLYINFILIILLGLTQSCAKKTIVSNKKQDIIQNTLINHDITDYQIVIAEHVITKSLKVNICDMTDFELESQFKIIKNIQGDLKINTSQVKAINCNHYYKQPFIGRKYDGLSNDYGFKWLLLIAKKNQDYFLVESELVFSLKDKRNAFCALGNLIPKLLNVNNQYLGEYVGDPISLDNSEDFYNESECYSIKGDRAYLDQGVIL